MTDPGGSPGSALSPQRLLSSFFLFLVENWVSLGSCGSGGIGKVPMLVTWKLSQPSETMECPDAPCKTRLEYKREALCPLKKEEKEDPGVGFWLLVPLGQESPGWDGMG